MMAIMPPMVPAAAGVPPEADPLRLATAMPVTGATRAKAICVKKGSAPGTAMNSNWMAGSGDFQRLLQWRPL
jgi:hypothetical protein